MSNYELLSPEDFPIAPWKNGRGKTRELYCKKIPNSDDFAWRLSIAYVAIDGPFSNFSGYDRTLVLIQGKGIELDHVSEQVDRLELPFDLCHFSGSWNTDSRLIDGPITDFNIISRSDLCSVQVSAFRGYTEERLSGKADHTFVYSLSKSGHVFTSYRANVITVPEGHLLHILKDESSDFYLEGSWLIAVQIFCT